eukprot:782892-Amphidinium_carterae.1
MARLQAKLTGGRPLFSLAVRESGSVACCCKFSPHAHRSAVQPYQGHTIRTPMKTESVCYSV